MQLSEEEQKKILTSAPRGTWAILLVFGLLFTVGWLAMYFGLFLARGTVS
jgi:hypothetical protein